jgi:hypothetical protein
MELWNITASSTHRDSKFERVFHPKKLEASRPSLWQTAKTSGFNVDIHNSVDKFLTTRWLSTDRGRVPHLSPFAAMGKRLEATGFLTVQVFDLK